MTRMPSTDARLATSRPMLPIPTRPRVAPAISRGRGSPAPHDLLPPNVLLLQADSLRNLLGEGKDQGDDMFSHHWSVNLASVGQDYIALDKSWEHELMDGGRGRMDPAEVRGQPELLRAERPGDDDFGIAQVGFDAVVAGEVDNFDLREITLQTLSKPVRRIPQLEAMMENDEKLHAKTILTTEGTEDTGESKSLCDLCAPCG